MARKGVGLDWYTVKYKDIYFVVGGLVLIVALLVGGFVYWRWAGNPETKAERAITRAQRLLVSLEKPDIPQDRKNALQRARSTLSVAEAEFKTGRFAKALDIALDLIDTLSAIKEEADVTQKFALLQDVEGQVEVKKSGQHLFAPGKENMALESGDIVKTGKEGSCRIKYHTGLFNVVNPDTLMVIQISLNPGGGSRIQTAVKEGTVEMETPETLKDNEESILTTDNVKFKTPAASRAALTSDKETGQTRAVVMKGSGVVEDKQGASQILAAGNSVVGSDTGLGEAQTLTGPPSPTIPRDGEIIRVDDPVRNTFQLEWSGGGSGARVQISAKPLFSKLLAKEQVVAGGRLSLQGLPAGTYYWRLRATGDETKTYWSPTFRFRILQIVLTPRIKRELKLVVEPTLIGDGVILQGSTDPGVSVSVNELEIPVSADGTFNKIVLFPEAGPQQVVVRAFDDQGNEHIWRQKFRSVTN